MRVVLERGKRIIAGEKFPEKDPNEAKENQRHDQGFAGEMKHSRSGFCDGHVFVYAANLRKDTVAHYE